MTKKSTRSPNYPAISLREAISKARDVYEEMHTHLADKPNIAKAMNYGGLNGSSSTIISALQKFNLLEPEGDELRIPDAALDVLLHSTGETARKNFIRNNAFQPKAFAELYEKYQLDPPNDNVIAAYLVKRGFNPKSVSNVIRTFRDTIEFVKEEGALEGESPQASVNDMQNAPAQTQVDHGPQPSSDTRTANAPTTVTNAQPPTPNAPSLRLGDVTDSQRLRVSRRGYVDITFYTGSEVTQEVIEKLMSLLTNIKDTYPSEKELIKPREAMWHGGEHDQKVQVTGVIGGHGGARYYSIEGSGTGIPEDELEFQES